MQAINLDDLSESPSTGEISHLAFFSESLMPCGKEPPTAQENQELLTALRRFSTRSSVDDFTSLENYLAQFPQSPWVAAVRLNLGLEQFTRGYYSRAMESFSAAWNSSKEEIETPGAGIADHALSELVRMYARLGRKTELERGLKNAEGREMTGSNAVFLQAAKDGLGLMNNQPGEAFKCGPFAVGQILTRFGDNKNVAVAVGAVSSTDRGTSMFQLAGLAATNGMDMIVAKRGTDASFVVPAVVHWKLGHYAALLEEKDGRYLVEDVTFGTTNWISSEALASESSGYFLIRRADLPSNWLELDATESKTVWGKGAPTTSDVNRTTPDDHKCKDCPEQTGHAMPVYNVNAMLVSLAVWDTPVGYQPPRGPGVFFTVTYNSREANQPANFTYANFGQGWSCNWLSFIEDDGGLTNNPVKWVTDGGGSIPFNYNTTTASYIIDKYAGRSLKKINSTRYEMTTAKGVKMVFTSVQGVSPRRVFLTSVTDEMGLNAVTLGYSNSRLVTLTDAVGYVTTITYMSNNPADADFLKIKTVTDPFNRFASFRYTNGKLSTISDVAGLSSSFFYGGTSGALTGLMDKMITPYGVTSFAMGETTTGGQRIRWLEATDPLNAKERWEYNDVNLPATEALPSGAAGSTGLAASVTFNTNDVHPDYRNVYYWDKKAMQGAHPYTDALLTRFTQNTPITGGMVQSIKSPLTSRVWFNYLGQSNSWEDQATIEKPSRIARVTDDGTTEITQRAYNTLGNLTSAVDSVGRETRYTYGNVNDVDVTLIEQKSGAGYQTVAQLVYTGSPVPPPHRPRQIIDASLRTTSFTYNAFGQVATITNPKNEVTTYNYDADGYLTGIDGTLPGTTDTMSLIYKLTNGKKQPQIAQTTDSESYVLQYGYDNLDRPITMTYPDGTWSQVDYNRLDPEWSKDRLNRWTHRIYDGERRLAKEIDPLNRLTQYAWCGCGALEAIIDAEGHTTTFMRDLEGRLFQKIYADTKMDQFTYKPASGRLATKQDAKNQFTRFSYFKDGQMQQINYTDAASQPLSPPTPGVSLTYDPYFPRRATMTDGTGTTQYAYNPITSTATFGALMLASITSPLPEAIVSFTYDELGRAKTRSVDGTPNFDLTYDALGRVTSEVNPLGTFGKTYIGSSGRVNVVTNPNSTSATYGWYPNTQDQRLQTMTHARGATTFSKFDYAYSAEGQIISWNVQNDALAGIQSNFGYDLADQLASVKTIDPAASPTTALQVFNFDLGGNRSSTQKDNNVISEMANSVNQLTSKEGGGPLRIRGTLNEPGKVKVNGKYAAVAADNSFEATVSVVAGLNTLSFLTEDYANPKNSAPYQYQINIPTAPTTSYSYDDNGNLTGDGSKTYEWDAADRLVKINYLGTSPSQSTQLTYDGLSRRVRISEALGGIATDQNFLWSGEAILDQRDAGNTITKRYYPQGLSFNAANYYYTRDHLASIREITDSTGNIVTRYNYGVWGGRTASHLIGNVDTEFGYTGHYEHTFSGLTLTHYRAYNAFNGRWLSRDPIGEEGGINLYGYVANNPVNAIDPLGLDTDIVVHRNPPATGQQARDASGTMSVFHNGTLQFSTPVNQYGYQAGSHGIYPGTYSVIPRTDADPTSHFPNGTPGVTAPGYTNSGDAGHSYHNVYIHPEANIPGGDSRGCQTIDRSAVQKIKDMMDADRKLGQPTTLTIYNYGGAPLGVPTR